MLRLQTPNTKPIPPMLLLQIPNTKADAYHPLDLKQSEPPTLCTCREHGVRELLHPERHAGGIAGAPRFSAPGAAVTDASTASETTGASTTHASTASDTSVQESLSALRELRCDQCRAHLRYKRPQLAKGVCVPGARRCEALSPEP